MPCGKISIFDESPCGPNHNSIPPFNIELVASKFILPLSAVHFLAWPNAAPGIKPLIVSNIESVAFVDIDWPTFNELEPIEFQLIEPAFIFQIPPTISVWSLSVCECADFE